MRNLTKILFSLNFLYILIIAAETVAIIFLCIYIPAFMSVAGAFAVIWLVTLTACISVAKRGTSNEVNFALVLMITALPVVGAIIYAVFSRKRKERGTLTVENADPRSPMETACLYYCGIGGADYDGAVYFKSGEEYITRLLKEIEKAEKYVYLEYFIICRGQIFSRLLSALKTAVSRGAEVRIIADGVGCAFKTGRREIKRLKSAGAKIKIFHRLVPLLSSRLNLRDHRKIAVIDGKSAFTGGINIADEYANIQSPYGYWKDTGVAVFGPASKVFEGMFLSLWDGSCAIEIPEGGKGRCLPYYDSPYARAGFCESAYLKAISSAEERIHIFTPYFCATEKLACALEFAARRGVDVRIIVPHVPDKKYAFELTKTSALPLSAAGVKFYEYTPGFMHAKSMVCDDCVFIGSYNFDFRSMRLNYECGIMFEGEICEQAERDFWECLRLSSPLTENKIRPPRAFLRFILKLFAPLV